MTHQIQPEHYERLHTIREAAEILGIHYWKLARAANAGVFPTYRIFNRRKLVRITEILAAINASAKEDWS